jgi:hypothetical protein
VITELRYRDPVLFWTGAFMLLVLLVVILISIGDSRVILGINAWIKPMKFLISVTIFLWSMAWFMADTRPATWRRRFVGWGVALAMGVEIVLILMQSGRGVPSHFNIAHWFDGMVFSIMGLAITFNTLVMFLFLSIIRPDTPPQRAGYLWGMRLGVVIFILASWQGFLIVSNLAHTVGAPDGGPGLPFVNWSTTNGDLRIAHFVGLHALQALPLLGFVLDRIHGETRSGLRSPRNLVMAASILWLAVMGGLLWLALQGRPLLPLS